MLRFAATSALVAALSGEAAQSCGTGPLLLTSISVTEQQRDYSNLKFAVVTLEIENLEDKAISIVDASITFTDALGGHVAQIGVERFPDIGSFGTFVDEAWYPGTDLNALASLPENMWSAELCVDAIAYADGSISKKTD